MSTRHGRASLAQAPTVMQFSRLRHQLGRFAASFIRPALGRKPIRG